MYENEVDWNKLNSWTLIDFWASWCVPCRKKSPELIKLQRAYNQYGFKVVAISFDTKKVDWMRAVQNDSLLSCINICDTGGMEGKLGSLFGIDYIPQNILLNKKGIIVAKNIEFSSLNTLLAKELMN